MAPVGEDEPTHDCPSTPSSPISPSHTLANTSMKASLDEISELHQRVAHLEDDNASLRANCVSLQLKLDQVQNNTSISMQEPSSDHNLSPESVNNLGDSLHVCSKCSQLSEELELSQKRHSELETLQLRLENQVRELEMQVQDLQCKEKDYLCKIKALEQISNEPENRSSEKDDVDVVDAKLSQESDGVSICEALLETSSQTEAVEDAAHYRQKLTDLEREYELLQEKCCVAEQEKSTMRSNIHKVSANWFERKARLSESEYEPSHYEDVSFQSDMEDLIGSSLHKVTTTPGVDYRTEFQFWFKRMKDIPKLLAEITFLKGKLDLAERISSELRKRVREYENVIDDQEIIIHGLKDQLDTYFMDNQKMSKQLSALSKLFEDIECSEKTCVNKVAPPEAATASSNGLPSGEDFKELSNSLSKTYIKLKELILEKKSLVTEIERLNILNVELQRRVIQQENRLISVSDALHTTWMLISDIGEHASQLHSQESILRYELKEKREILHKLREELECSREQWHKIRQMNNKSEEEWNSIKEELDERRRAANNSENEIESSHTEGAASLPCDTKSTSEFEPPVDLLLDMAIEYGVIEADDDTSTLLVAAMEGEDIHASRLQDLEEQCSHLYQKLMASTSRSLTLASRLTALHQHYGSSDDDDDDDEDDEYEEDEDEEEEEEDAFAHFETEVLSPEPESYDTAYVSEVDTGSASGVPGVLSEEEVSSPNTGGSSMEDASPAEEQPPEVDDDLCRGLINFLPRKIEILRRDNQKLEEKLQMLQEEKLHSEAQLTANLETERIIRQQLEEKLEHLGKCVDELNLERNGQITEAEEKLKQKVSSLSQREKEYESIQEEFTSLQCKFEERGKLLLIANDRVNQLEKEFQQNDCGKQNTLSQLNVAKNQANEFKALNEQLKSEYEGLKQEIQDLQQQITDLQFQVSSHSLERDAANKSHAEKSEALEAAEVRIVQQDALVCQLQEQTSSQQQLLQNEKEQHTIQVEKLNKLLADRDKECSSFNQHLQEVATALETAKQDLSETKLKLGTNKDVTAQLSTDNDHLREKIIQLLSRRVRVCDDCFSVHAELATIIASPAGEMSTVEALPSPESSGSRRLKASQKGHPLPVGSQVPDDEEFSVISDDELQSSRLSSSPSNGSTGSNETIVETRAIGDILSPAALSASPLINAEVWVGAGTRVLVPIDLPAGVTLHWEFSAKPKSVSFAVLHQPPQTEILGDTTHLPQLSQRRVLIPTTRVASTEGAIVKGRLQTKQPGVYTLVFDNSYSKETAKKVTYSLRLENQLNNDNTNLSSDASSTAISSSSSPSPSLPLQTQTALPEP
ncbi:hypothetical protein SK128_026901 [Halocaridina rubra]|uniref:GOLD domain-containing protein n=1 Tax=Halocaridina rubra TaxID=373956 RepID=A0AAN8WW47_HALRR